jgi:hypothetical protein
MPNLAMATDSISGLFNTGWNNVTPVEWPNVAQAEPHLREGSEPWCAFDLMFHGGANAAISNSRFTREGRVTVRIFVPAGERGLERANALCMTAINIFEGQTVDGVSFYNVGPRTVGPADGWYQINVSADFEFDEVK